MNATATDTAVTRDPLAPCGYCRRCAIHDDPGGCLTVEAYEREQAEQTDDTRMWNLHVYSEDFVSKPEISEVSERTSDWYVERAMTSRDIWETLKRSYAGKGVPVHYADGTHSYIIVPR